MSPLDQLQKDHGAITEMLETHRAVTIVTPQPVGVQILLKMYGMILEDALKTLSALIEFLTPKSEIET